MMHAMVLDDRASRRRPRHARREPRHTREDDDDDDDDDDDTTDDACAHAARGEVDSCVHRRSTSTCIDELHARQRPRHARRPRHTHEKDYDDDDDACVFTSARRRRATSRDDDQNDLNFVDFLGGF